MAVPDCHSSLRRLLLAGALAALFSVSCGGGGDPADWAGALPGPAAGEPAAVTVRGVITAAPYLAVDSSVNDPNAPYRSNLDFADAQAIGNPVLLGGYITREATGVPGDRFEKEDDRFDTFLVTLAAGPRATMFLSDFAVGKKEARLVLRHAAQPWPGGLPLKADDALGVEVLQVTAPQDGEYFLDVQAVAGGFKYVLAVGSMPNLQEMGFPEPLRPHLEMVPGEVIVSLRDQKLQWPPGAASAGQAPGRALAAELGMRKVGGGPGRENLLRLETPGNSAAVLARLGVKRPASPGRTKREELRAALPETVELARGLAWHPAVARAIPNYLHRLQKLPDDPHYHLQWHYPLINLPAAWEITTGSAETVVAVVDSGVFLAHPDLAANLTTTGSNGGDGWNFANCAPPQDCANPDDPGDSSVPGGSSWHGTHVAGTVAAVTDNTSGVAGAAWRVSLMPVRVCGQGGTCSSHAVLQGVRYAAGLDNDSGRVPQRPADVINLSLAGPAFEATAAALYQQVCEAGIIVVGAAGNNGTQDSPAAMYPAAYPCVLSVAALDARSERAPYSHFGPTVDLAAPGGNLKVDSTGDGYPDGVLSTLVDDRSGSRKPAYGHLQGTSMAAPQVAGVMALMRSLNPGITPAHIRAWLQAGGLTEPLGGAVPGEQTSNFGYGRLDALRAVRQAQEGAPPVLVANPALLSFEAGAGPRAFTLQSVGGDLRLAGLSVTASWLDVSAQGVDDAGLGTYRVAVDAGTLLPGNHTAKIVATAESGPAAAVTVTLRVPSPVAAAPPDAGVQYVLLQTEERETLYKVMAQAENGEYHFKMEAKVEPGNYYLSAGSDLDNDTFICTPGESCGAYPTADQPMLIEIKAGQTEVNGIDFITTFGAGLNDLPALQAALPFWLGSGQTGGQTEKRDGLGFGRSRSLPGEKP
jgi:serine protease